MFVAFLIQMQYNALEGVYVMEIYEKIKNRRKELGLTADDVANSLGISRATVYRYESAEIEKVPITALVPLAKVLKCSPGYLMGWEDDTDCALSPESSDAKRSFGEASLDANESRLVNAYRSFNSTGKAKLMDYVSDLESSPRNYGELLDSSTESTEKDNLA